MRKILLTSAGFENGNIGRQFINLIQGDIKQAKVLFVPTAANTAEAKKMVPKCKEEILWNGIVLDNIVTYDLDHFIDSKLLLRYDAIYFTSGNTQYLMDRINEIHMADEIRKAVNDGLVYVGVSAGSIIATASIESSLDFIPNTIDVHCTENISVPGAVHDASQHLNISDNQAIFVYGNVIEVIE